MDSSQSFFTPPKNEKKSSNQIIQLNGKKFLLNLKNARNKELLCDYTLIAQAKHFKVHKLVLAASSPYFETKFSTLFEDAKKDTEELPSDRVSSLGLEEILNCMYEQTLNVCEQNVVDIYMVAHYLQMDDIVKECQDFMINSVTDDSCLAYFKIAEVYGSQTLMNAMEDYLLEHYSCTANPEEFVELSSDFVIHYMSSQKLKCQEYELFKAALKWINHDPESRKNELVKLMSGIKFGLMSNKELVQGVGREQIFLSNPKCYKMWLKTVSYQTAEEMYEQPFLCDHWNQPRSEGPHLLVLSRTDMQFSSPRKFVGLIIKAQQGKVLGSSVSVDNHFTDLLKTRYGYSSSVQINNFLFIIGGVYLTRGTNSAVQQDVKNFVWRYSGMKGTCKAMAPLLQPRAYHASFCIDGNIYAAGGTLTTKPNCTLTTEKYDVRKNTWSSVANLPFAVKSQAGCAFNGKGFLSGGERNVKTNHPITNQFLEYLPDSNNWQVRTSMLYARSSHSMVGCGNRIYVFGGCDPCNAFEMYNPVTYEWTALTAPNIPHVRHPVLVAHNDDLMVVGGHYPLSGDWEFSNEILRYGTKTQLWKASLRVGCNIVDATTALMKLSV